MNVRRTGDNKIMRPLHHLLSSSISSMFLSMATTTTKRSPSPSLPVLDNAGLMMILSPAKTLNLQIKVEEYSYQSESLPLCDVDKTNELVTILKKKSKNDLKSLMKISDNLASSVSMVRLYFVMPFLINS